MKRALPILCFLTAVFLSCSLTPPTLEPLGPSPSSAVTEPQATLAPEEMPTAVPLWTPTATAAPPSAQPTSEAETPIASQQAIDPTVIAVVNGQAILRADYDRQLAQAATYLLKQPGLEARTEAGQRALQKLQEQVLNWMIDQVLIEQAAAAKGIRVSESQVEAEIARMRGGDQKRFNDWLAANGLTLETLRQQVRTDLITAAVRDAVTATLKRRVLQAHFRHILTSTESAAEAALRKLQEGQNFIAVARQLSEDETTRKNGGDLGFLPKGVMPPAFEEAGFALKPGEISGIVQSEFGFHIIQLVEIDPEREVSDELWPMVQQRAFEDWLAAQRARATIQLNVG